MLTLASADGIWKKTEKSVPVSAADSDTAAPLEISACQCYWYCHKLQNPPCGGDAP